MALKATNLTLQVAPLPPTFKGTPNDLVAQIVARTRILSPSGTNFIFIGDTEPTSNVGPWLKGGTQWWVWSDTLNKYVPVDISASFTIPFWVSNSQPPNATPPVWLKTEKDQTDQTIGQFGNPVGWFFWNPATSAWVPWNSEPISGPTSARPANPENLQQFYDTDIGCLIWFERSQWRTVSGVPGDVKSVLFTTLGAALIANPGWAVVGDVAPQLIGRVIMQATQDPGATPAAVLNPPTNVPSRAAFDTFGENSGIQSNPGSTLTIPPQVALWHLYKQ